MQGNLKRGSFLGKNSFLEKHTIASSSSLFLLRSLFSNSLHAFLALTAASNCFTLDLTLSDTSQR
jgi:hypothetical protein